MKLHYVILILIFPLFFACSKQSDKAKNNAEVFTPPIEENNEEQNQKLIEALIAKDSTKTENALSLGADPDLIMPDGETTLTYSIKTKQTKILSLLIFYGAILEKPNLNGDTPVLVSIKENNVDTLKILVGKKANLDVLDINGTTALNVAIELKNEEMANFLLENEVDLYLTNSNGKSALDTAVEQKLTTLEAFLKALIELDQLAPSYTTLITFIKRADIKRFKKVITLSPQLILDNLTPNLLKIAMAVDDVFKAPQIVLELLEKGANPNGNASEPLSPITFAAKINNDNYVGMLINYNANVNSRDEVGNNALMYAVEKSNLRAVILLLSRGADKKYKVKIDGKNKTICACAIARKVGKTAQGAMKDDNKKIKNELNCGIRGIWPFTYFDF